MLMMDNPNVQCPISKFMANHHTHLLIQLRMAVFVCVCVWAMGNEHEHLFKINNINSVSIDSIRRCSKVITAKMAW